MSIASGKLTGIIKFNFVFCKSLIRWYSLPHPFKIYLTVNSSPILAARNELNLSLASKILGKLCSLLNSSKEILYSDLFLLYQIAS